MFTYTTRKDGRLMKKVVINGKPKYLYSDNPKDLEKQYIGLKHLSYSGFNSNNDNIKLKEFALKWKELNSIGKESGTIKEYDFLLNSFIFPRLGNFKIKDIKVFNIKQLIKDMEDKLPTAKKALQLIKRILDEAVDNDIILKNVASNVKAPKIIKKEKKPLTIFEDELLLKNKSKHSSFFILKRYSGMRKEEIVPLEVDDIDLKNRTISINKAVTFINNQPVLKSTKNKKSRIVPILDIIYDIVVDLVNNAGSNKLIFTKETDGKMLTESAVKRHLESFLYSLNEDIETINKERKKDNKIPSIYFTCHSLRHSYCTMLYYANVGIKKAQDLMGHQSSQMVYDIYTHLDEERENSEELINNYLKKLSKSCQINI